MNLGEQIRNRRKELNITQEELANKLNVTRSAVSNWETEKNFPDLQTIVYISDELNVSLDVLLKGDRKLVEKISRDSNENPKLKKKLKKLIVIIILLCIICIMGVGTFFYLNNESYIPYSETGIKVTNDGDMYVASPYYCYYATYTGTNNEIAFLYLTKSNGRDKATDERVVSFDNDLNEENIEIVYYLPEKYVEQYNLLDDKHHNFIPTETELKEIESSNNPIWKNK